VKLVIFTVLFGVTALASYADDWPTFTLAPEGNQLSIKAIASTVLPTESRNEPRDAKYSYAIVYYECDSQALSNLNSCREYFSNDTKLIPTQECAEDDDACWYQFQHGYLPANPEDFLIVRTRIKLEELKPVSGEIYKVNDVIGFE
jgi:hypothetical protein